jgi:hypothetical protein
MSAAPGQTSRATTSWGRRHAKLIGLSAWSLFLFVTAPIVTKEVAYWWTKPVLSVSFAGILDQYVSFEDSTGTYIVASIIDLHDRCDRMGLALTSPWRRPWGAGFGVRGAWILRIENPTRSVVHDIRIVFKPWPDNGTGTLVPNPLSPATLTRELAPMYVDSEDVLHVPSLPPHSIRRFTIAVEVDSTAYAAIRTHADSIFVYSMASEETGDVRLPASMTSTIQFIGGSGGPRLNWSQGGIINFSRQDTTAFRKARGKFAWLNPVRFPLCTDGGMVKGEGSIHDTVLPRGRVRARR